MSGTRYENRLKVADFALFFELLDSLLEDCGGTQTELERRIGIKQDHFSKLRSGKLKSITASTYNRIRPALKGWQQKKLMQAFALPGTAVAHERYRLWLTLSLRRMLSGTGPRWSFDKGISPPKRRESWRQRAGGREGEITSIQRIGLRTVNRKGGNPIAKFIREQAKRGHSQARITLAVYRVLAPLIETSDTAFVERHRREMSEKEFEVFVKAGLTREDIMLNRSPDIVRIQENARLNRQEFVTSFGRENISY